MGAATFFVCAIFSATAFGGRPGPPGRHFPRTLRRRRRPFFAFGLLPETLPSTEWIAERTSSRTVSRIAVSKLLCLGIAPSFGRQIHERRANGKGGYTFDDRVGNALSWPIASPRSQEHLLKRTTGLADAHVNISQV